MQLIDKFPYLAITTQNGRGWEPWLHSINNKLSNKRKELRKVGVKSVMVNHSPNPHVYVLCTYVQLEHNCNLVSVFFKILQLI